MTIGLDSTDKLFTKHCSKPYNLNCQEFSLRAERLMCVGAAKMAVEMGQEYGLSDEEILKLNEIKDTIVTMLSGY